MSQLTTPRPIFEQCWSWKENVRGGADLLWQKRSEAIIYLSDGGKTYTPEQLRRETICRWNGGSYHEWNGTAWQRPPNIICALNTHNIGCNTNRRANNGKTLEELLARDREDYRHKRTPDDQWGYIGVCYVDSVLGGA